MISNNLKKHITLLRLFTSVPRVYALELLKRPNSALVKCIAEIALNINQIPSTDSEKLKLRRIQKQLKVLASKSKSLNAKRSQNRLKIIFGSSY